MHLLAPVAFEVEAGAAAHPPHVPAQAAAPTALLAGAEAAVPVVVAAQMVVTVIPIMATAWPAPPATKAKVQAAAHLPSVAAKSAVSTIM